MSELWAQFPLTLYDVNFNVNNPTTVNDQAGIHRRPDVPDKGICNERRFLYNFRPTVAAKWGRCHEKPYPIHFRTVLLNPAILAINQYISR
jgi:hypothetical protein